MNLCLTLSLFSWLQCIMITSQIFHKIVTCVNILHRLNVAHRYVEPKLHGGDSLFSHNLPHGLAAGMSNRRIFCGGEVPTASWTCAYPILLLLILILGIHYPANAVRCLGGNPATLVQDFCFTALILS